MADTDRRWPGRHALCTCPETTTWPYRIDQQPDCPGGTIAHPAPLDAEQVRALVDALQHRDPTGQPGLHWPHCRSMQCPGCLPGCSCPQYPRWAGSELQEVDTDPDCPVHVCRVDGRAWRCRQARIAVQLAERETGHRPVPVAEYAQQEADHV